VLNSFTTNHKRFSDAMRTLAEPENSRTVMAGLVSLIYGGDNAL